eukprot:Partr_v1_DN29017_c0_g2_i8_m58624 putative importin
MTIPESRLMNMNIGDLFAKTLSANQQERESATARLEQIASTDFPNYVLELSKELVNEQQQQELRIAAGLALKNSVTAKDESRLIERAERWISLQLQLREAVKQNTLNTLSSPSNRVSTAAAQTIAAIASIEIPRGQWGDLMNVLLTNVTTSTNDSIRQNTLQTIGFICESMNPEVLESFADGILTAVIQGARKEEPNQNVRLAAISAFTNSLDFVRRNFENPQERDYIMQVVCEATSSSNIDLVSAAFECLVQIMSRFYECMQVYMQQALFALTITGMRSDDSRVALQAIEFWSTVCDVEIGIEEERLDALEFGEAPTRTSFMFSATALPEIVPVLLWLLTQQEEDADEDEWNTSMAAGTCLSLLAACVKDEIVAPVVQFVEANIRNQDWRLREAACMAFGSILDGPQSSVVQPLVSQALPVIIDMMQDPVTLVKDTAAWTLGKISELHVECIRIDVHMKPMIEVLLRGLEQSPRVSANCAWAIVNLSSRLGQDGSQVASYPLSPYFEHLTAGLLKNALRSDGAESNLRANTYEALSSLILYAANDCITHVEKATLAILERLEASIAMEGQILGQDDKSQLADLQVSLCGVVQSFTRKLGSGVVPLVDRIMVSFFSIFQSASKTTTTVEDVFLAIGVIINTLESDFARYMESFVPFLYGALQNPAEHQLCGIAVGIIADLCRGLGVGIIPYCNQFMQLLSENLQSNVLHREVKPQILSCFGDIALAVMGQFEQYLSFCMTVLLQASQIQYDYNNDDMRYYAEDLFEGILEAYTGIVQGLKAEDKAHLIVPYVDQMFFALKRSLEIPEVDDKVVRGALGLLGDMASSAGTVISEQLRQDWIEQVFRSAKANRAYSTTTREVLKWSRSMVKKATA